jgi:hypothetical protein
MSFFDGLLANFEGDEAPPHLRCATGGAAVAPVSPGDVDKVR